MVNVFTMPRLLRGIFRKRRELLLDLSQCSAEAVAEYMRTQLRAQVRPGIVVSIATSGDMLQWHPHGHLLVTDGAFSDDGTLQPLAQWDTDTLMRTCTTRSPSPESSITSASVRPSRPNRHRPAVHEVLRVPIDEEGREIEVP